MGYHVIDPTDLDPTPDRPCTKLAVSDAADLEEFALNVYEAEPGEQIPLAYHLHTTQEEAMYVLSGTMHVQTPAGEHVVRFIYRPLSFQAGSLLSLGTLALLGVWGISNLITRRQT